MAEAPILPPYLTESEVDDLCKPVTQRAAQRRRLCQMLGIKDPTTVPRRPDGLPLIGRKMAEQRLNPGDGPTHGAIRWSK